MFWQALRTAGYGAPVPGFGRLLELEGISAGSARG
jgi:hypothetical protein